MADKTFEVTVRRRTTDVFRAKGRNGLDAANRVYAALLEKEDGDGVEVVQVSHTIDDQKIAMPKAVEEAQQTIPGTA